jgi:hypothetical protein
MRLLKIHQRRRVEEINPGVSGLCNRPTRYGSKYKSPICAMQEKFGAVQNESVYRGVSDHLWFLVAPRRPGPAVGQR